MSNNEKEITVQKLGRPSLYKDEFVDKLKTYFSGSLTKKNHNGDEVATDFPTLEGFALSIGVSRDTLHEWANAKDENGELKHQEFSDAVTIAKDFQKNHLTNNGLHGRFNAPFAMFIAKASLGMRDKLPGEDLLVQNNNSNSNLNNNVSESEIDKKIQEKLEKLGMGK